MDAFVLPGIGVLILCVLVVVWTAWLGGGKASRALAASEDDEPDES